MGDKFASVADGHFALTFNRIAVIAPVPPEIHKYTIVFKKNCVITDK